MSEIVYILIHTHNVSCNKSYKLRLSLHGKQASCCGNVGRQQGTLLEGVKTRSFWNISCESLASKQVSNIAICVTCVLRRFDSVFVLYHFTYSEIILLGKGICVNVKVV